MYYMDETKSESSGELSWTQDIENMLDSVLQNTNELSVHHCSRYLVLENKEKIDVVQNTGACYVSR